MIKYCGKQMIVMSFPADGTETININSLVPIDKIRISCSDVLSSTNNGIFIWSDLVSNTIGSISTDFIQDGVTTTSSTVLRPKNGIEYWYDTQMLLQGEYNIQFRTVSGALPAGPPTGIVKILIEYFAY